MDPNWTICLKSGQNFSRSGPDVFIPGDWGQPSLVCLDVSSNSAQHTTALQGIHTRWPSQNVEDMKLHRIYL